MATAAFNAHPVTRRLEKAKFSKAQVDAQVEVLVEITDNLATKDDIESLRLATKDDIESLKIATHKDIESLRLATQNDIESLRLSTRKDIEHLDESFDLKLKTLASGLTNSLTFRFGAIAAIVGGMVKYLP